MKKLIWLFIFLSIHKAQWGQDNRLQVYIDERMELLTVVQYLSGYPILTPAPLTYKKEVESYFAAYKTHPAVELNKKIYPHFFYFDGPPSYLYYFSFPDFTQIAPFSETDIKSYGFDIHNDTLRLLLKEFKDFYHKTNFQEFCNSRRAFFDSLENPVRNELAKTDVIAVMEKHYGQKNASYNVVLTPLLHDGGYGPLIATDSGNVFYAVIGPKYNSGATPEFDTENILAEYVIHEFSHSFCNPLIDKYWPELEKDSCLLTPILESQEEQGYGTWKTCLYEHFVRANEIILNELLFGEQKADAVYTDFMENGKWIYLEGILPIIKNQYLNQRDKHKTLDGIMPEIIQYLHTKSIECR